MMKEILVWLDAAWMVSVNSFHACLWLAGCSEFTAAFQPFAPKNQGYA